MNMDDNFFAALKSFSWKTEQHLKYFTWNVETEYK